MAEERTLGLARAQEKPAEDLSKEDLQRRLDDARETVVHPVTKIKESATNQAQAVRETLDWRKQFKKRPVAWSAGAMGVGFVVGYGIAAAVRGDGNEHGSDDERYQLSHSEAPRSYAAQAVVGQESQPRSSSANGTNGKEPEDQGPGFFERLTSSSAYDRVRSEAGSVGNTLLEGVAETAKLVVVPALIKSLRDFLGGHLPGGDPSEKTQSTAPRNQHRQTQPRDSSYQPLREV